MLGSMCGCDTAVNDQKKCSLDKAALYDEKGQLIKAEFSIYA